jgi:hypothetical protein
MYDALVLILVVALTFAAWIGLSGEYRSIGDWLFDGLNATAL